MVKGPISRRHYKDDVGLSVLGFGGMLMVGMEQPVASRTVAECCERGINYFDVAPFYGDEEAEKKMGIALEPFRGEVFLACKTLERTARGAEKELNRSLRNLRTDHFDLYQFHAVTTPAEVSAVFARRGAVEAFVRAREQGKIRYVGFSAHSVTAALLMLEHFRFDSVLFPVNFVCYAQGNFGPQVIEKAEEMGVARLAIKSMAYGPWNKREKRKYPKCWYRPIEDRDLALLALRFTLSEHVTAAIPPGDERLFRMALELSDRLAPLGIEERRELLASTRGMKPLLQL